MTQQTNPSWYKNIRIVLVNTSHPGNIGAAARAMKNMGLSRLYLVSPKQYMSQDSVSRAAGAVDVLDDAVVVDDLKQALSGCVWVAGTSARLRTVEWPVYAPRECVAAAIEYIDQGDIAIVFGRENSGLTNEELECCNALLHIPTNAEYSSLNLAAAVQLVCYELRLTLSSSISGSDGVNINRGKKHFQDVLADADQMEGLYQHLYEALVRIDFFGSNNPEVIMRRLKSFFKRANTTQREASIFRGICSTILKKENLKKRD
jgi:tRNA (cytidine32/uridine32-2'-O)-methyltransferase